MIMKTMHTISLSGFDPFFFFQKLSTTERSPSLFTSGAWTVIAWNPQETIVGDDISALDKLKKSVSIVRPMKSHDLPFVGGAIGYVSYDAGRRALGVASRHRKKCHSPEVMAHVYDSALLFDGQVVVVVGDLSFLQSVCEIHARPLIPTSATQLRWSPTMSRTEYARAFRAVKHGILRGDFYQLNLSYQLESHSGESPRSLFVRLARHLTPPMCVYIEHRETAILSMSPERFVTIDRKTIRTEPIKGTRARGRTDAIDQRLRDDLLTDPKESAELSMIVDLLRNDIGKVSRVGSVAVTAHRCLQKNPSVWHTYSVIEGKIDPSLHPIDAFISMLPGGSVTGCPKVASMEAIDRLEKTARGPYTGSAFMLSSTGFFDSSILIRTVVQEGKRLSLGIGGGIVHDSVLQDEYDETLKKAERFLSLPAERIWINGKEVQHDVRSRLLDPSMKKARGAFETMRGEHGRIQSLRQHLDRLEQSLRCLKIVCPFSRRQIERMMRSCLRTSDTATSLRWKIVCTKSDVIIASSPLAIDPSLAYGVRAMCTQLDRRVPLAKALPYHREWQAHTDAQKRGFAEAILVNKDGTITEGAYSNIFWVIDGVLYTKKDGVLPGIMRATVIKCAKKLGLKFSFGAITPKLLLRADEVFMTSSLRGVTPIVEIDGTVIGDGKVGRVTERISKALNPWSAPRLDHGGKGGEGKG